MSVEGHRRAAEALRGLTTEQGALIVGMQAQLEKLTRHVFGKRSKARARPRAKKG